ncbi:MAG: DUF3841 domain-containing protein [Bacteroidales bacterium]|nr:DUF3841 domain-containing protein [Bacteroidales bacterium]
MTLNRDGVLYADSSTEDSKAFHWMLDMMCDRIPSYEAAKFPIWAKAQVGSYKKQYNPSGKEHPHGKDVLLVLDVPENELLLFDSDMWDGILSDSLDDTWENIFDLNYRSKRFPKMKRNKNIQAVMWKISSEWVRGYRML